MKIKSLINCGWSLIRNIFIKLFHARDYKFSPIMSCPITSHLELDRGGQLSIGNHLSTQRGFVLTVRKGAQVIIGDNVQFNYDCIMVSRKKIIIGNNVMFGPGCKIYDHDHNYKKINEQRKQNFVCDDIIIGDGCWFGANCVILKGTTIGNNCVFSAGSIVRGVYGNDVVVAQNNKPTIKTINYD